ncbi:oocyte zinc finger protein XlCOF6 [Dunckerocampus dactyliophorus]|uniref:oocyte zinc finger protein XlCOF6 n=1 Tax=Dunckerocampus dactyliophorus TaxID=161453 RepID=UPI0024075192|nr:oocyte zinc finger protein XlCOF6 [Dunckerocampus dactyliophorus]
MKVESVKTPLEDTAKADDDVVTVKCENDVLQSFNEEDGDSGEYCTNGEELDIRIKEEPHSLEITEVYCGATLSYLGSQPEGGDDGTPSTDGPHHHLQGLVKVEPDLQHGCEFSAEYNVAVKEESLPKEEEDSHDRDNIEEEEDGEEVCTESSEFFPCPHCDVSFTDLDFLEKHVKWVHQKEYLAELKKCLSSHAQKSLIPKHTCTVCGSTFSSKVYLRVHVRESHPSAPTRRLHPCPTCVRSFQYLKNLKNHCQRWHSMSVVIRGGHLCCVDCGKSFKTTWGQGPHLCHQPHTESEEKPICLDLGLKCSECGKKLSTPQSLDDHMRIHTGDRPFVCKDCGRRFVERSSWRQHQRIHTGEKPHKCQVCGKAFQRGHQLKCHLTTHSAKKEYSCSQCGKEFGLKASLNLHLRTHSSEKPFQCPVCGKSFNTRKNLRVHSKLHNSEKSHQCGDCGLKISDLGALKIHLRTHTGERPYHCTVCGNKFIRLAHLRNHQRTHTGERPYKCNECDKSFTQSGDLVKHKRIHSGEKPFECPDCHRRYTSSGDLGKHRRTHTNLRPYICQECGKSFRLSGHLKTHMRTHTGEKPYSCPNCLRRFARSHHLSGHIAKCR